MWIAGGKGFDVGRAPNDRLDGGRERRTGRRPEALVVLEDLGAAYLRVGAFVDVADQIVEGVLDRRGEHERPGDERQREQRKVDDGRCGVAVGCERRDRNAERAEAGSPEHDGAAQC